MHVYIIINILYAFKVHTLHCIKKDSVFHMPYSNTRDHILLQTKMEYYHKQTMLNITNIPFIYFNMIIRPSNLYILLASMNINTNRYTLVHTHT